MTTKLYTVHTQSAGAGNVECYNQSTASLSAAIPNSTWAHAAQPTAANAAVTAMTWPTWTTSPWSTAPTYATQSSVSGASMHVTGNAQVDGNFECTGDIRWQNRDLGSWLEAVESRLGILHTNLELEAEFEELRRLGDDYRAAEQRFLEQRKIYNILKDTHGPNA